MLGGEDVAVLDVEAVGEQQAADHRQFALLVEAADRQFDATVRCRQCFEFDRRLVVQAAQQSPVPLNLVRRKVLRVGRLHDFEMPLQSRDLRRIGVRVGFGVLDVAGIDAADVEPVLLIALEEGRGVKEVQSLRQRE